MSQASEVYPYYNMWTVFFHTSTSVQLQYPKPAKYKQNVHASDMSVLFQVPT